MLATTIARETSAVRIGGLSIRFMRTLRLPEDGSTYPLPPGLGTFPIRRIADYADRVPESWREGDGVFIPMYAREAMWLAFSSDEGEPHALKVGAGRINAVSGEPQAGISARREQDYVVAPDQPWRDGFNADEGAVRQFVAMPLGEGYTVEGQLTGEESAGALQIHVHRMRRARWARERAIRRAGMRTGRMYGAAPAVEEQEVLCAAPALGLAAGGRMHQEIDIDPYGPTAWERQPLAPLVVHLLGVTHWELVTGEPAPPTPVDVHAYADAGLPWFDRWAGSDVTPSPALAAARSVREVDEAKGLPTQQDDCSTSVGPVWVVDSPSTAR